MKNRNKIIFSALILVLAMAVILAYNDGRSDMENVTESVENRE